MTEKQSISIEPATTLMIREFNKKNSMAVHFSSEKEDWATPQGLFDSLAEKWGPFGLDAAADKTNAKCLQFISKKTDALKTEWHHFATNIWINPPYGRSLYKWVEKAWNEAHKGCRVVMLIPSRTDTKWFHHFIWDGLTKSPYPWVKHLEFIPGRIKFEGAIHSAPFPSLVVVFEAK